MLNHGCIFDATDRIACIKSTFSKVIFRGTNANYFSFPINWGNKEDIVNTFKDPAF